MAFKLFSIVHFHYVSKRRIVIQNSLFSFIKHLFIFVISLKMLNFIFYLINLLELINDENWNFVVQPKLKSEKSKWEILCCNKSSRIKRFSSNSLRVLRFAAGVDE